MSAPQNISGLTALAMQLAADYYNQQAAGAIDEVFPGTYNWQPDGIHDLIWTISEKSKQGSLRVMRTQWNQTIKEFQHSTPLIYPETAITSGSQSGQSTSSGTNPLGTNIPAGVGGHSVSQTIKDTGSDPSQNFNFRLLQNLPIGQTQCCVDRVDFLPTQNRWAGIIDSEKMLFEGTQGGIGGYSGSPCSGTSGFILTIVNRGIDNTFEDLHNGPTLPPIVVPGASGYQSFPDTTYGVNLTTYEKAQFVYPQEISFGVQGLRVVPQLQTVLPFDDVGVLLKGIRYFSGQIFTFDPSTSDNPWRGQEYVWIVERNQFGVVQKQRYDGQFVGYSPSSGISFISGCCSGSNNNPSACSGHFPLTIAPVYVINSSGLLLVSGDTACPGSSGGVKSGAGGPPGNFNPCFPNQPSPFPFLPSPGFMSGCPTSPIFFPQSGIGGPPTFSGFPFSNCCIPSGTVPFSGGGGLTSGGFLVGPTPGIVFIPIPNPNGGSPYILPVPIFPTPGVGGGGAGGCGCNVTGVLGCTIDTTPSSLNAAGTITISADWQGLDAIGLFGLTTDNCNTIAGACPDNAKITTQSNIDTIVFDPCDFQLTKGPGSCPNTKNIKYTGLVVNTQGFRGTVLVLDSNCNTKKLCFRDGLLKDVVQV